MRKQFLKSAFAVSLISLSIFPLTTSSAWGKDTASKQQRESVIIAIANKSRIAQLINKLEERTINSASKAAQDASQELVMKFAEVLHGLWVVWESTDNRQFQY